MKQQLLTVARVFREHGLRINFGKTKFMITNPDRNSPKSLDIAGEKIERVVEFVYLGALFTDNSGKSDLESQYSYDLAPVQHRLRKAHRRYCGMYQFFRGRAPVRLKTVAFFACVYPVATWGAETWPDTAEVQDTLDIWFRNKLRRMLGVARLDHITNEDLYNRTISTPLPELVRERRLRYLGHIVRYPSQRWVRIVLEAKTGSYSGDSAKKS